TAGAGCCRPGAPGSIRPPSRRWRSTSTPTPAANNGWLAVTTVINTLERPARAAREVSGPDPTPAARPSEPLYKPREPIYPKLVHGRFRRLKWMLMALMLAIYYGVPWIRWSRPQGLPQQAVMVDFSHGRFWFGPIHLWPQD